MCGLWWKMTFTQNFCCRISSNRLNRQNMDSFLPPFLYFYLYKSFIECSNVPILQSADFAIHLMMNHNRLLSPYCDVIILFCGKNVSEVPSFLLLESVVQKLKISKMALLHGVMRYPRICFGRFAY